MSYAKTTKVPVERSVAEIQKVLTKSGASGFAYATQDHQAFVAFRFQKTAIKMKVKLPYTLGNNATAASIKTYEQRCRQIWRALLLVIKAKITSVESGIETFEQAFLPYIVLKDGGLVGEKIIPSIDKLNTTPSTLLLGL